MSTLAFLGVRDIPQRCENVVSKLLSEETCGTGTIILEQPVFKCPLVMAYGSYWTGFKYTDLYTDIYYIYILYRHLCI